MTKSIVVAMFVFTLVFCIFGGGAAAQPPSCWNWVGNGCVFGGTVVGACPGWFNCSVPGPYLLVCQAMNALCFPATAHNETCPFCPKAGHPISLATGTTYIQQSDVRIPGLSNGLSLVRTWLSQWPSTQAAYQIGIFGSNWRSTYEEQVFVGGDHYIKYARADGSFWSFGVGGPGWTVAAPANVSATLTYGSTYWTMTFQNGEQRQFDNKTGSLIAIIDRNGNTTSLSYDSSHRLVTVTDPVSRHLNFTYGTNNLVSSVTSDVGLTLSYSYDSQGRLTQVTYPDSTTISFTYNSLSQITAVTDQNGKTLESHTYDSNGRGLTSSQALGVSAVTATYH